MCFSSDSPVYSRILSERYIRLRVISQRFAITLIEGNGNREIIAEYVYAPFICMCANKCALLSDKAHTRLNGGMVIEKFQRERAS